MCHRLRGAEDEITENDVMDVAGVVPEADVNNLITMCHSNSFDKVQAVSPCVLLTLQCACNKSVNYD